MVPTAMPPTSTIPMEFRAAAPGPLREAVDAAVDANQDGIRATILGGKLLQLLLPGTADTYQGCEVVNLSLVDPDNRRPVDFDALQDRLTRLETEPPFGLDDEKLLVVSRALRLRREHPGWFGPDATYEPLPTTSDHAVAFARSGRAITVVTRLSAALERSGGWGDATVTLPAGTWRDVLTGGTHQGGAVSLSGLLNRLPVSLLERM